MSSKDLSSPSSASSSTTTATPSEPLQEEGRSSAGGNDAKHIHEDFEIFDDEDDYESENNSLNGSEAVEEKAGSVLVEEELMAISSDPPGLRVFFKELHKECLKTAQESNFTVKEAQKHVPLNRYADVLPYDHTRVTLQSKNDVGTDYINANFVSFPQAGKQYIAAQGPKPNTVADFWRMIWEQKSGVVVMTTNVVEKNVEKCFQYFPNSANTTKEFAEFTIELVKEESGEFDVTRTLRVKNGEEERIIIQHHYVSWPDHGVPRNADDVLQFLEKVRVSAGNSVLKGPVVMHCSAGIGRTGTFCVIDVCLQLYEASNGKDKVNVLDIIREARTYRVGMVQTFEQLEFCYLAIIEGMQKLEERFDAEKRTAALPEDEEQFDNVELPSKSDATTLSSPSLQSEDLHAMASKRRIGETDFDQAPADDGKRMRQNSNNALSSKDEANSSFPGSWINSLTSFFSSLWYGGNALDKSESPRTSCSNLPLSSSSSSCSTLKLVGGAAAAGLLVYAAVKTKARYSSASRTFPAFSSPSSSSSSSATSLKMGRYL